MVNIKMEIRPDGGSYTASGHCRPELCEAICVLEDTLDVNLRRRGLHSDGMIEDGERRMEWTGEGSGLLADFIAVAFEEISDSCPDEVYAEVTRYENQ